VTSFDCCPTGNGTKTKSGRLHSFYRRRLGLRIAPRQIPGRLAGRIGTEDQSITLMIRGHLRRLRSGWEEPPTDRSLVECADAG
jgi:hypothetical protein